ncbi:MAG: amino acid ABC transporter substrate-binding protein [Desulfobacteraceae bacterium]|nr:MAG: amino acid ABC transporter substrate-binding protein [Desulfobacteraceae bacterium]
MKKKGFWLSIVTAVALFVIPTWGLDNTISIMTESGFVPFNDEKDGKAVGLSTEMVQEILKRVGHADTIQVLPWARAVDTLDKKENTAVYSMMRTPKRETLYKWVGPLAELKEVMFAKKGSGLKITSLDDAKKVKSIGVSRESASHQFLTQNGFTNADADGEATGQAKKLMIGRINLWFTAELSGYLIAKDAGVDTAQMEVAYEVNKMVLYMAFNKNTSDEIVKKWQKALDDMKADGTYNKILAKYK